MPPSLQAPVSVCSAAVLSSTSTPAAEQTVPITNYFRRSQRNHTQSSRLTDPNSTETVKCKVTNNADDTRRSARARRSSLSPTRTDNHVAYEENENMPGLELASSITYLSHIAQARKTKDFAAVDPRDELTAYLSTPLQAVENVVAWGHHSTQYTYPTLSRMTRDYLAIQGSATVMAPYMLEALQLLKSAYHNNHVGAAEEAAKHVIAALDALDDENNV
ncbi:hypothetical protein DFH09DRAFT_1329748 [Mycena vulgaris]|nr:hypothetical protein DFH09DRAFT_1329748 [Mycena vulgaris]